MLFRSYPVERLIRRSPLVDRLLRPQAVLLAGRPDAAQRHAAEQMRENRVEDIDEAERACMEADGMVSVIKRSPRRTAN